MASMKARVGHRSANPIETASSSDRGFVRSELSQTTETVKNQVAGAGSDFISQLLGMEYGDSDSSKLSGDMKEGEAIDLTAKKSNKNSSPEVKKPERKAAVLAGIDYRSEVVHGTERLTRKDASELDKRIEDILVEIKRLIGSSTILKAEFAVMSVEDKPVEAGKYYLNFFEWMLIEIKRIRMKVEDAGAWLSVMKSKKSQKKYGKMAKTHGTSFTLANERTPATQTG